MRTKFLKLVKENIYSPTFYRSVLGRPLSFSLKYFYTLVLGLSIVLTFYFSFLLVPRFNAVLSSVGPAILKSFPDELRMVVKNGELSVNVPEPFSVPLSGGLRGFLSSPTRPVPKNLVVVDTRSTSTFEEFLAVFKSYDTLVLLTRDSVVYYDTNLEGARIKSLKEIGDMTITKSSVVALTDKVDSFLRFLPVLGVFGIFVVLVALYSFKLVYLFFVALLILLIGKMRGVGLRYGKAYQIGIHAMTLSLLIYSLFLMIRPAPRVAPLFTVLMLLIAFVNLKPQVEDAVSEEANPPTSIA